MNSGNEIECSREIVRYIDRYVCGLRCLPGNILLLGLRLPDINGAGGLDIVIL